MKIYRTKTKRQTYEDIQDKNQQTDMKIYRTKTNRQTHEDIQEKNPRDI